MVQRVKDFVRHRAMDGTAGPITLGCLGLLEKMEQKQMEMKIQELEKKKRDGVQSLHEQRENI